MLQDNTIKPTLGLVTNMQSTNGGDIKTFMFWPGASWQTECSMRAVFLQRRPNENPETHEE